MLSHPDGLPIAVTFDTDCDGTSIGYFDCDHRETTRLPYGAPADEYVSRDAMTMVLVALEELRGFDGFTVEHWQRHGYASDDSGIRNCEVSRPVEPSTLRVLAAC